MNFLLHCFEGPQAGKFLCEDESWSEHPCAERMCFPTAHLARRYVRLAHLRDVEVVCAVPDGRYNILLPLGRSERRATVMQLAT